MAGRRSLRRSADSSTVACRRCRSMHFGVWGPARLHDALRCFEWVRFPREAALFRQRGDAWRRASAGRRRLVTWRSGACSRLELHPVGCFLVCGVHVAAVLALHLLASAETGPCDRCGGVACCSARALVRVSIGRLRSVQQRWSTECWLRPASRRDASCIGSACAVSRTQRESSGRLRPVCASAHVHTGFRLGGWIDEQGLTGGVLRTRRAWLRPFLRASAPLARFVVPRDAGSRSFALRSGR